MTVKACSECGVETSAYSGKSKICNMCKGDRKVLPKFEREAAMKLPPPRKRKRIYKKKDLVYPEKVPSARMKKFLVTLPPEKLEEIQRLADLEGMPYTLWVRTAIYNYADFKRGEKERLENFYKQKEHESE